MPGVTETADELYRLPPAQFTAARDAEVARARERGDRSAANALAGLKRPTLGAWLVNLLALRRPEVVDEILGLGEQIRDAQVRGESDNRPVAQLRDLSAHRRRLLDAALLTSRSLAGDAGAGEPTAAALAEAEGTLAAAMADDDAARLVRSGRVVKALSYAGFGGGFGEAVPVRSAGARSTSVRPMSGPRTQARDAAADASRAPAAPTDHARQRTEAAQRVSRAEATLDQARADERAADEDIGRLTEQLAALRESLEQAQSRSRAARAARLAAQRDLESAQRRFARIEGAT
jgi:hypothetical protein